MRKLFGALVLVSASIAGEAAAAPLLAQQTPAASNPIVMAKVICDQDGQCQRPPKRRPVARWVYGDGNFYGPYTSPGYYGNPRLKYRVFGYFWW